MADLPGDRGLIPVNSDSPERPLDLIGIGECMVELSASVPLRQADSLDISFGGDVMNALMMAARLGGRTGFLSRAGDDAFGQLLTTSWERAGIDLSHCPLVPGRNGMYIISSLPDNQHEFWYYRKESAAAGLGPEDVDADYIASSRALLLSGITQAISESAQAATLKAARLAREAGTLVFYDPNVRLRLWAERGAADALELAYAAVAELLPYVDVVFPSHPTDASAVNRSLTPSDHADHALRYLDMGVGIVGMKLGSAGCCIHTGQESVLVDSSASGPVIDSTGAGDAWNAAFIMSVLQQRPLPAAARFANEVASWKVTQQGAIPRDTTGLDRVLASTSA